ncbi:MAG: hypothetical protein OEY85_08870 [Rhodospirillales bacterium]|nr:hypothetical protein [Rhodospirillales bacterium]
MDDRIIAVKRTPEGLVAVLSRRQHDFWKALDDDNLVDLVEMYDFIEEPLDNIHKSFPHLAGERWLDSWRAVAQAHCWDENLLHHVLKVLINTVPVYPKNNLRLPVLNLETEEPAPKKTAANPRGLRTAKGKKQKPKARPEIDLQPYLCDPKNVSTILNKLKPFWTKAVARIQKANPTIFFARQAPTFSVEPYFGFRHPASGNAKRTQLPRFFLEYFIYGLSDLPWRKVKCFLALYHELGLERDSTLLSATARLLSEHPPEQALTWLKIILDLPAGKRYSFLLTLLETHTFDIDFKKYPPKQIRNLANLIPYEVLEQRLEEMFWTFNQNVSMQYLEGGYRLAKKYGWHRTLELRKDYSRYPAQEVENLLQWLKPDKSNLPFDIWKRFGQEPYWESVILRPEWTQWSREVVHKYIDLLNCWMDYQPSGKIKKWIFRRFLEGVDTALNSVDKGYQLKLLRHLKIFLWQWEKEGEFNNHLPRACALLIRLAKKPIPYGNLEIHQPVCWFIEHLGDSLFEQFLKAPDSSFTNFHKDCQTENKRRLIARGLYILSSELPELSVNAFTYFPGKLFRVARGMGTLRFRTRLKIGNRFSRHQLMKVDLEKISPRQLFQLVEKYYQQGMTHPVPKKLQAHFKGEITLSETRIRGYHHKSKVNFLSFVLDVLNGKTMLELNRHYSADHKTDNWQHALQFFNWVDRNRRGFKNWFRAYLGGDNHYIENHPETRKWFSNHKNIDVNLWNRGILFCRRTEKHGPVRIELESDPLEILKMGTYVGSCLSLGGHYAYSAVAVLLDLNKQVLYARNAEGKVIGRQLIAISKNDRLVCFSVYPEKASREIKSLFFEYDIEFSRALHIPLYEHVYSGDKEGYTIESILSEDWWDDYPWGKIAAD